MSKLLTFILLLITLTPVTAQSGKWRFLVYGDTRGTSTSAQINTNILSELARATTNTVPAPAFVLVPGDLVYSGTEAAFQSWTNIMTPVYQAGIGVYTVMGNHDIASVSGYLNTFGPLVPDNGPATELNRTYFVRYNNALVLALDTYVTSHQVNVGWINAVLATNDSLHVFAMGHDPAFKVNHTDCLDDYPTVRSNFWNSLSNAVCRVYFCGHDHFYDHMRLDDGDGDPSNDIHQMIVGTGGAPLYTSGAYNGNNGTWTPVYVLREYQFGYVDVEVDGPVATLTWHRRTGPDAFVVADTWSYSLAPVIVASYASGELTLTWSGGGRLQSAPNADGPWTTLADGTSPYVRQTSALDNEFYRVKLR